MLEHHQVWDAIDRLAESAGLSTSGLARKAGLDPTSFNKSKRFSPEGKPRWPSTESIAKILAVTGTTMSDFFSLGDPNPPQVPDVDRNATHEEKLTRAEAEASRPEAVYAPAADFQPTSLRTFDSGLRHTGKNRFSPAGPYGSLPMIGWAQAGSAGFFDENGYPQGEGWDDIPFPFLYQGDQSELFALEITGDSMRPLYRDGDILIVAPGAQLRRGDRVVVKTCEGEVMAKELKRLTSSRMELVSLNPDYEGRAFELRDIVWAARIFWVSQ